MRIINLDPAADNLPYKCDLDIRDLITLDDVVEELNYGPNGGLVYCMEYKYIYFIIYKNIDIW